MAEAEKKQYSKLKSKLKQLKSIHEQRQQNQQQNFDLLAQTLGDIPAKFGKGIKAAIIQLKSSTQSEDTKQGNRLNMDKN